MKIRFVLNRPRNPKNIGAAARGMANFGFRDLAVVKPYAPIWRETRSAVRASDVIKKAKRFNSLKAALKSSHLVIGTSAGSRRGAGGQWIGPDELKKILWESSRKSVALLFGSEKSGLSNEDLAHCHYILKLPTAPDCPSMNLAQAVAVVAYTISLGETTPLPPPDESDPVTVENVERLIMQALAACTSAGLLKGWDPVRSEARLRKAFYRWNLNSVDIAMLHGIFRWINRKSRPTAPYGRKDSAPFAA